MVNNIFGKLLAIICFSAIASTANALPSLQLGGGSGADWTYDTTSETWVTSSSSFTVNAVANATNDDGGIGDYAWDDAGAASQIAYMVFAGVPNVNVGDGFDISVKNDDISLSLVTSGYGAPPIEDPNSPGLHGIYDSYFEIYKFQFDKILIDIKNTQPGQTETGKGYAESFDITINSLNSLITGVHMDLFTISGTGELVVDEDGNVLNEEDKKLVKAYAPFSHDAEYISPAPEPATTLLLGIGVASLARIIRGKKRK